MASNCSTEAALKMEVVSSFETVLLTRQCHTPQEYTQSQYIGCLMAGCLVRLGKTAEAKGKG